MTDYQKMYLTLFNAQVDIIEDLEKIITRLQLAHYTAEEIFISSEDDGGEQQSE